MTNVKTVHGKVVVGADTKDAKQELEKFAAEIESRMKKVSTHLQNAEKNVGGLASSLTNLGKASGDSGLTDQIQNLSKLRQELIKTREEIAKTNKAMGANEVGPSPIRPSASRFAGELTKAIEKSNRNYQIGNAPGAVFSKIPNSTQLQNALNAAVQRQVKQQQMLGGSNQLSNQIQQALNKSNLNYMASMAPRAQFGPQPGLPSAAQLQSQINAAILRNQRQQMQGGGMSASGALQAQINAAAWRSNAAYMGGMPPPPPPPRPPNNNNRGGRGFGSSLGFSMRNVLGGVGIGAGMYGVSQLVRTVGEVNDLATAYDRMEVASRKLAGSQEQLNSLLATYATASGGAVDKSTALANVTRLQAIGIATNNSSLEQFVRGTRGASIALGKPQEYIEQEAQLAVSNTSQKRLDQIGLGIEEVSDRIKELRTENSALTREMAFGQAVIQLLNEKYGGLADTVEGQATGLERLRAAWKDLRLEMGQNSQSSVNRLTNFLANAVQGVSDFADKRALERHQGIIRNERFYDQSGLTSLWSMASGRTQSQINAQRMLDNPDPRGYRPRGDSPGESYAPPPPIGRSEDQQQAMYDYQQALGSLEKQYANARLEEAESYEQQRESIIIQYGKSIVREERDFARQRARGQRDFDKSIADIGRDAGRREAEWREDLDRSIRERQEDSAERIEEIEEDHRKDRERAEEEHRDRLLKAAGALDAIAVLEEQKRWKRENQDREEAHKVRVDD
jgi:hypothetical protein